MSRKSKVIFVCEHGAAKSILAAAYFNELANEMGSDLRAIARGTNPDQELSLQAVAGLSEDGLQSPESSPKRLTETELRNAQHVIAFCELPVEYQNQSIVEHWEGIPPVSENYEHARDAILMRLRQFLNR